MLIFIEMKELSDNNKLLKGIFCGEISNIALVSAFLEKPLLVPMCCLRCTPYLHVVDALHVFCQNLIST